MTRLLSCEQAVKQFFAYLDRALAGEPLDDLEAHLETCLACCDKLAFSRRLDNFVKSRLPQAPVPDGLEARIRRTLGQTSTEWRMSYFTDADARKIISATYEKAQASTAVAAMLYAPGELSLLPPGAVALALGVNHPVRHAALLRGERVLDIGCGAGIDTLLAARAVGSHGRVVGLDMTPAMLDRARGHIAEAGADNIELREGLMEALPFPDGSFDVVVSNGVLSLSTRKSRALAEMLRVLRPGGRVALGDLVLTDTLPEALVKDPTALAVWLAGALAEPVLRKKLFNVGFEAVATVDRRPFGFADLARYPLFPPEFLDFVRRVLPSERDQEIVHTVVVTGRRPL